MENIFKNKWIRRIGIGIISIVGLYLIAVISVYSYYELYLPYHYNCMIEDGMQHPEKADSIALILADKGKCNFMEMLINSAEKGNVKSMVMLGEYYRGSDPWSYEITKDEDKSSYWYLQAARKGSAEAMGGLGYNYEYGIGVPQDFDKAIYWTMKGASKKDPFSLYNLGNIYSSGIRYYRGYIKYKYIVGFYDGNVFQFNPDSCDNIWDNPHQCREYAKYMDKHKLGKTFIKSDINKAKYYWKLSANQGFKKAKEALEKVYEGDD